MNTDGASTAVLTEAATAIDRAATTVSDAAAAVARCESSSLGPLLAPFLASYLDGLERARARITECADLIGAASVAVMSTHDTLADTDEAGASAVDLAAVGTAAVGQTVIGKLL